MSPRSCTVILLLGMLAGSCEGCRQGSTPAHPPRADANPAGGWDPASVPLPADAARWVDQGVAEYRQGKYLEAAASFKQARDLVPADPRVSTFLGTALLHAKRYTPAQEEFHRILTLHPEAIDPRLGLARIYIRLGDYPSAIPLFQEVLSKDPNNAQALYNLGLLRYRTADYAGARELLERLLTLKADLPEAHYTLALTCARQGDDATAEKELQRAVALAPENSQAHFQLASLYVRKGRKEEAEREQKIFERLWDRQASDRAAEGRARELLRKEDYAGALKEYNRLLEINPQSGRFQLWKGLCFLKLGRKEEALPALERAVALDPRLPDAQFQLAILYQERGEARKSEEARRAFEALEAIGENKTGF
ncbi:MAG TPA: tetratricopeptide repeat protein [Candidatus Polarisedimenticolia bacterium]|nr:tetratricopeptide repeat protein [Candidatus Polarisedimenticolia bacterium]